MAGKLLDARRGRRLFAFLAGEDEGDRSIAPELIVRALRHESTINPPAEHADDDLDGMSSYCIGKLSSDSINILECARRSSISNGSIIVRSSERSARPGCSKSASQAIPISSSC